MNMTVPARRDGTPAWRESIARLPAGTIAPVAIGLLAISVFAASGCASTSSLRRGTSAIAVADTLVAQGCYACLLEARSILQPISSEEAPRSSAETLRLFEVELLIVLRQKELGIKHDVSQSAAQKVALRLAPLVESSRYLNLVDAVPVDDAALPAATRREFVSRHQSIRRALPESLKWLTRGQLSPTFRAYLSIALECAYAPARDAKRTPEAHTPDAPLILRYRAAICGAPNPSELARVREEQPRFTEVSLFEARAHMAVPQGIAMWRALERLAPARTHFPQSVSAAYLSGLASQVTGNCGEALVFLRDALRLEPEHERAALARVICLSYVGDHSGAIESATRLIDAQAPGAGDAYYWRAWNRHRLRDLTPARQDIARAKALLFGENVLTLSGILAYESRELETAVADLHAAKSANRAGKNCEAMRYLALIDVDREEWIAAARRFTEASSCFDSIAADTEKTLGGIRHAIDADPAFRDSQVQILETTLRQDREQAGTSAYNASLCYLRGGDSESALKHLERVALDPVHAQRAEELRRLIKQY